MENQTLDSELLHSKEEGKSLSALLANGYETNSVAYIKKGLELFKQNMGPFIGFIILVGIIQGLIGSIPYLKSLANVIIAPIAAGAYIVSRKIDKQEPYAFSDFFDGVQLYKPLFIVSLIPTVIIGAITLVVGGWEYFKISFLGLQPSFDMNNLQSIISGFKSFAGRGSISGLLVAVVFILTLLSTFLVLFEKFEPVKALEISAKLIKKRFFNWVGFILLLGLFNLAGLLCLVIGLFVTVPSSICALYVAYEDVVGLNLRD
jgi:hypothetical protein